MLTAGPWLAELAPTLQPLLVPERQVLGWFEIADHARFAPTAFPVFVLEASGASTTASPSMVYRGSRSVATIIARSASIPTR